jgi:ABC-type iron transport system FetAB permease component
MRPPPPTPVSNLMWSDVFMAFLFVAFNLIVSRLLQLQVGSSLLVAALRCMAQLTVVADILQNVLAAKNMWAVAWITRMSLSILVHAR